METLIEGRAIDADRPFAGSPSEKFADGADGIVIPGAMPVEGFSFQDVAEAYKTAKELLEAAYLDRSTLLGGHPDAYANLLDPEQRAWFLQGLVQEKSTRYEVMSFAPGIVDLVGPIIKVQGSMSAISAVDAGNRKLYVAVEYRFVYAVRPKGRKGPVELVMSYVKDRYEFGGIHQTARCDTGFSRPGTTNFPTCCASP
ncbi:hypothetical protein [Acrocarpospora sp. B8E8]|uniref:hypothetical protein n=1 Tax=Acrocarpospora sp. B8E8 TaxID=3153572 RepID=UPI00325F8374